MTSLARRVPRGRAWICRVVATAILGLCDPAWAVDLQREVTLDIQPQPLTSAVIEFAKQTGIQVVTDGATAAYLASNGVRGTYTIGEALRLLLAGTGLEFRPVGERTVALTVAAVAEGEPVAQPPPPSAPGDAPPLPEASAADSAEAAETPPQQEETPEPAIVAKPGPIDTRSQTADGDAVFDTIIVTAGKRAQDIREFAGSVAAMKGDFLEKMGAQSTKDYLKMVPGVTMNQSAWPDYSAPIIRGIATDSLPGVGAKTVGIFVDDVPMSNLFRISSVFDLYPFDLERVEVLKGPQGTLFGSSAIAGALRYITNKPKLNVWESKVLGSYMSIAQGGTAPLAAAMLNVPLLDSVALRAVGNYRDSPGYIDDINQNAQDIGGSEQYGYRLLGSWLPTDRLSVGATFAAQRTGIDSLGVADQRELLENGSLNGPSNQYNKTDLGNLVATYDFDWGQVFSTTSYSNKYYTLVNSADRQSGSGTEDQPNEVLTAFGDGDADSVSQEFRVLSPNGSGPWTWLVGVAGFRNKQYLTGRQPAPFRTTNEPVLDLPSLGTPQGTFNSDVLDVLNFVFDAVGEEAALFGEVSRKFFDDRFELLVGGRWFDTRMVVDTTLTGALVVVLSEGALEHRQRGELHESGFNPKVSARVSVNDNVDVYALAAKGFQFGGVQIIPPSTGFETIAEGVGFEPYKSSDLWNYEVGARSEWWDHRLQLDATVFYMDWKELQLDRVVSAAGQRTYVIIDNLGRATSQGLELAMRIGPEQGLSYQTSATFIEAVSKAKLETSSGDVPPDTQLPGSSRFQMANTLSYEVPFSLLGHWNAGLTLTHSHTGRVFNDLFHSAEFGSYDLFDVGVRLASTTWRLQPELNLTLSNLTDVRGVAGIETYDGAPYMDVFFVQPRTGMVLLNGRF